MAFETIPLSFSSSQSLRFTQIFFIFLFFFMTLILAYGLVGSNRPSFVSKSPSHVTFFTTNVNVTYSTSVNERATVDCYFEHQLIGLPLSIKIQPDIDLLIAQLLAQLESKNPLMIKPPPCSPLYMIPISLVTFRYQRIVFTTLLYQQEGFFTNRLTIDIVKMILSFVSTIENIIEFVILWQYSHSVVMAFFLLDSSRISFMRVFDALI